MKRLRLMASGALCATAVILPLLGAGAAQATAGAAHTANVNALTQLTLKNGWTDAPFSSSRSIATEATSAAT